MTYTTGLTQRSKILPLIFKTGFLAGTLDGISAMVHYTLRGGKPPEKVFKFVASGFFGKDALFQGYSMVFWGVLFHFAITFIFTVFFFFIYPKIHFFSKNRVLTGIIYGLFVWLIMNLIVLPNSNTPKFPFNLMQSVIGLGIIVCMIGMPLSFMIGKYYTVIKRQDINNDK